MKRRGFLGLLAGLFAAPAVPALPEPRRLVQANFAKVLKPALVEASTAFDAKFTHVQYGLGVTIHEDDEIFHVIGRNMQETKERIAAGVFNRAFER